MGRFKFDIENKIVIPFTVLILLPIILIGLFSYWNSYEHLVRDDIIYQKSQLKHMMMHIQELDSDTKNGEIDLTKAQNNVFQIIDETYYHDIFIQSASGIVFEKDLSADQSVTKRIEEEKRGSYEEGNTLYIYNTYEPWDWTIILGVDKSLFREELITLQKNTLLLTIIFLVLSIQAIIIIAHNISKPIRRFADVCNKIEDGNMDEKVGINRKDEIGILSNSFDNMIDQINSSTKKILEMTKYNENILQSINLGIFTVDEDSELVSINMEGHKIFEKYKDVEILDTLLEEMKKTIDSGTPIDKVIDFNSKYYDQIYFSVRTTLLRKNDGTAYGGICSINDITERRRMQNNIIRADRLSSVGEFAAGLAHEIRNPLAGLKTGIQVIENRAKEKEDNSSTKLLGDLIYEIDRINLLVTDLLDFSRPQNTVKEKVSVNDLLQKSIEMSRDSAYKKQVEISWDGKNEQSYYSYIDKRQIEQVFLNLITNAIDAVSEKGILKIRIDRTQDNNKKNISVMFEDNGPGINKELREKIFNPFFTTKAKGTGLGLPVAAKLVDENDGTIKIENKAETGKGIGTIIYIRLQEYEG